MKEKWYLRTWFIALMFALWYFIVPLIIGIVLLFMKNKQEKLLSKHYADIDGLDFLIRRKQEESEDIIKKAKSSSESIINETNAKIDSLKSEISKLRTEKSEYIQELKGLKDKVIIQTADVSDYDHITSEEIKNELVMLRINESDLIKNDNALIITSTHSKKALNNNVKQMLRCFNSECSNFILNTNAKNIEINRSKIVKSFNTLNSIFSTDGLELTNEFLELKLKELNLLYSYQLKKEQEKEQQKAIKEQMVEEEKVRREIEQEKKKIEKEESQFKNEVSKLISYLQKSDNDIEKNLYIEKIKELEDKLKLLEIDKENVLEREQNTRAGFVYIISNIGSFGEDVYKIGMTRRLEPMDRVKELGSASVPFEFDVHAMIFSEDAPTLETTLHHTFRHKEINKVNSRKEFFKVDLSEIEKIVKESHNSTVEFTMIATATQYRESIRLSKSILAETI